MPRIEFRSLLPFNIIFALALVPLPSFLPSSHHLWDSPTSSLLAVLSESSRLREIIDTEHRTRHAYRLASRWLPGSPLTPKSEITFIGPPVSEIKSIPGREHRWLLAVSKGIWSALTIYDLGHHLVAEVLGTVSARHGFCWGEAEHGPRV
ncbi:hypothetical protein ARMGADRAFT_1086842 [Armillaria gallica]|uniref:Uncharacterized protein n=1 Tax=Armillaria gallica TaxID=47427 RepID=A0A2H3DCW6_ARMGA|nr:hypothetical protein ARMGADRAFT_1086842 [Armillaria gallica]